MSQMIESVESRILFIGSAGVIDADFVILVDAGKVADADLAANVRQGAADAKAVKAAVVAAHPTAQQKALVTHLESVGVTSVAQYKAKSLALFSVADRDGKTLEADLKALKAKPTSSAILAKVDAAVAKLQALFSNTSLAAVQNASATIVTNVDTALNSITTAIPSTSTATGQFESHLATDLTTLATNGTAIQTALNNLAAALA